MYVLESWKSTLQIPAWADSGNRSGGREQGASNKVARRPLYSHQSKA